MNSPAIHTAMAWVDRIRSMLPRGQILKQAEHEYDEIVGRFDIPVRIPSEELEDVTEDDEAILIELGAEKSATGAWVVPKGMDLEPFAAWWPKVPEDLRDTTPRMQKTRSGNLIEAYVLPEDQGKGQDSTATSLMFAALPVIAALSWVLAQIAPWMGSIALLLAIPYVWVIKQGEGAWTAVKAAGLLLILPLVLTNPGLVMPLMGLGSLGLGASPMAFMGPGLAVVIVAIGMALAFVAKWIDKGFASAVEKGISMVKLLVALIAISSIGLWLGQIYQPLNVLWVFAIACTYPLFYVNENFIDRAVRLDAQSKLFNLGTQGALSDAHVEARKTQAVLAAKDKSPLIEVGTSTGYLTEKQYPYAPDKHAKLMLSVRDMSTHMLVFGKTGGGKTSTMMRPTAYMIRKTLSAGALILDGKGALAGEIGPLMDLVIKPGVNFGLIQGMTSTDLSLALSQIIRGSSGGGSDGVWVDGADLCQQHAVKVVFALHEQELAAKDYWRHKVDQLERQIAHLELDQVRREKLGEPAASVEGQIRLLRQSRESVMKLLLAPSKWPWTVSSIQRFLSGMNNVVPAGRDGWDFGPEIKEAFALLGWNLPEDSPRRQRPETIHPEIGRHGPLDASLAYLNGDWLVMPPEQRSSFFLNINNLIQPLFRGEALTNAQGIPWHMIEKGEDVTRCLRGEFVGVDLPEVKFGPAGRLVSTLVKQRIYAEVRKRQTEDGIWPEGHLPVMVMIDEAQLLVGQEERALLPIARSLGMMAVFATQTIEGLLAEFRNESETYHFCETFQNLVCLDTSIATLEFVSRRLGQAELVLYKSPTVGLDYAGGVLNLAKSAGSDLAHPSLSALRQIERRGGSEFEVAVPALRGLNQSEWRELRDVKSIEDAAATARVKVPVGGVKEIQPVLSVEEMSSLLRAKGMAVVVLNRAGTPRVDIAKLNHIDEAEARKLPRITRNNPTNQENAA